MIMVSGTSPNDRVMRMLRLTRRNEMVGYVISSKRRSSDDAVRLPT